MMAGLSEAGAPGHFPLYIYFENRTPTTPGLMFKLSLTDAEKVPVVVDDDVCFAPPASYYQAILAVLTDS